MKKVASLTIFILISFCLIACSNQESGLVNNGQNLDNELKSEYKVFQSTEGWEVNYPAEWEEIGTDFIRDEETGKSITFSTSEIIKEDIEKWIINEINRKLSSIEAENTLYEDLSINQTGPYTYYSYTIKSKIESAECLLKNTVIFDGHKKYEFRTAIPPMTEKEYQYIISSFKAK